MEIKVTIPQTIILILETTEADAVMLQVNVNDFIVDNYLKYSHQTRDSLNKCSDTWSLVMAGQG